MTSGSPSSRPGILEIEPSAAHLEYDPEGADLGAIGSPQGDELSSQGFRRTNSAGSAFAGLFEGLATPFVDPQQHEAPRQFLPQWQAFACASTSKVVETLEALASTIPAQANTRTKIDMSRLCRKAIENLAG